MLLEAGTRAIVVAVPAVAVVDADGGVLVLDEIS